MQPFEIWLAKYRWHGCDDERPWLLVRPSPGGYECFPISTKSYGDPVFPLETNDPDFAATGLRSASFIHDFRMESVPTSAFIKRWGELQGELLRRFRDSSGV
jgi:hypothetical protein